MRRIIYFFLLAIAVAFSGCGSPAGNTPANNANAANANTNNAKPVAAAPTKDALLALEKSGWDAWKNKDGKFFEDYLSTKYVGFGPNGRTDKAAAIKSLVDAKCDVKGYSWSDEQMKMVGSDVAVLTFKAAQDYTCDGKKGPASTWSSSVYVREGDKWKNVLYVENPVVDPNAPPAKSGAPAKKDDTVGKPADAKPDALTDAMMVVETKGWEAWKKRDVTGVQEVMGKEFMYVSGAGRKDKADAIKGWSEPKCEGLGYSLTEPMAVSLTPDVAFVTYKANVQGTCDGKPVDPSLWVASFDLKEGENWKNAFYTDVHR